MDNDFNNDNTIIELDKASEDTLYDENPMLDENLDRSEIFETNPTWRDEEDEIPKEEKITEQIEEKPKKKEKVKKPKKEFFWKRLSKKGKIITVVCIALVLLLITLVLLYFLVFKKEKLAPKEEEKVVIQKDKYVYENGVLKFLDGKKTLGTYKCENKDPEKCLLARYTNEDGYDLPVYIDSEGKEFTKESKVFLKRYVFVTDGSKIVFYDLKDKEKIEELKLIKTGEVDKDLVVAKNESGKYGLYSFEDDSYTKKIDFKFDNIGLIYLNERIFVKDGEYSYIADLTGGPLSNKLSFTGSVKNFDNNYIALKETEGYSLYNYQGQKVLKDSFEYIDFAQGYIFAISEGQLYVYNKSHEKLNEKGIKLKTSNYQKRYVFDKKKNLDYTEKPYDLTVTTGSITVDIYDGKNKTSSKIINLYEVALNKDLAYFKYLDGNIFIYSDEERNDLIGTYDCVNKNNVTSTTTEFTNCTMAKETNLFNSVSEVGYAPILNGNYAFIYDTAEGSTTKNVALYNITAAKTEINYQEIDTGKSSPKLTFIDSKNELVFARNRDGNLGALIFTDEGPKKVISFKDKEGNGTSKISKFNDQYLLVVCGPNKYLYTNVGQKVAKTTFDIIEYNNGYLVVKNKGYLVYKMASEESGTIISKELDYIKLYNDYFVGIKDKKINVYRLSDGKTPLIKEEIKIINTKLASSYRINFAPSGAVLDILKTDGTVSQTYKFDSSWNLPEVATEDE